MTTASQPPHIFRIFSFKDRTPDAKLILYYTGLEDINKFRLVLSTLLPMAHHLHYRGSCVLLCSVTYFNVGQFCL